MIVGSGLAESIQGLGGLPKRFLEYGSAQAVTPPSSAVLLCVASSFSENILQDGDSLLIFNPSGGSLDTLSGLSFNERGTGTGTVNPRGGCPLLLLTPSRGSLDTLPGARWGSREATVKRSLIRLLLFLLLFGVLLVLLSSELSFLFGLAHLLLHVCGDGHLASGVLKQCRTAHDLPFVL